MSLPTMPQAGVDGSIRAICMPRALVVALWRGIPSETTGMLTDPGLVLESSDFHSIRIPLVFLIYFIKWAVSHFVRNLSLTRGQPQGRAVSVLALRVVRGTL